MNLHTLLQERATKWKPVRVGLIGTGKFGAMFLARHAGRRDFGSSALPTWL
jgi:predicted homoserine dehydrogenase-like protein